MKFNFVGFSALAFAGLCAANLHAQTPATTAPAPATTASVTAPSALSFSPSVTTGVRSYLSGELQGGSAANQIGPFITPSIELAYKSTQFNLGLTYEFEAFGGQGYGSGNNRKDFEKNVYFIHDPVLTLSGGLSENWKFNGLAEFRVQQFNQNEAENYTEIVIIPEIERKLTSNLSLSVGYFFHRVTNFDVMTDTNATQLASELKEQAKTDDDAAKKLAAVNVNPRAVLPAADPVSQLHAGLVRAKVKFAENTNLDVYVRGGKYSNRNQASGDADEYNARLNADLKTKVVPDVSLALRYRFNANVRQGGDNVVTYYNLGRVIADYELTENLSVGLQNEFAAKQSTAAGKKATFENETYLGTTFSF